MPSAPANSNEVGNVGAVGGSKGLKLFDSKKSGKCALEKEGLVDIPKALTDPFLLVSGMADHHRAHELAQIELGLVQLDLVMGYDDEVHAQNLPDRIGQSDVELLGRVLHPRTSIMGRYLV